MSIDFLEGIPLGILVGISKETQTGMVKLMLNCGQLSINGGGGHTTLPGYKRTQMSY